MTTAVSASGRGALMLWIDVDPAMVATTDAWYADEHLPDRIHVGGYARARRWIRSDDAPSYLSVFDTDTPEALVSDGYLRLVATISAESARIRRGFSNVARDTFVVRASRAVASGGVAAAWRLRARADANPARLDALVPTLVGGRVVAATWYEARPDVRARMDARRVTGLDDARVAHALVVEAGGLDELEALRRDRLHDAAWRDAGFDVDAFDRYRLMVDFVAEGA